MTGTPPTPRSPAPRPPARRPSRPLPCDKAQFITDVTVPDGTTFAAGSTFNKTWRLKNVGNCTWTTAYQLVFYSGAQMGGPSALNFPSRSRRANRGPDRLLTAPNTAGSYRGYWMFKNANNQLFGIGAQANKPWWVDIRVTGSSIVTTTTPTLTHRYSYFHNTDGHRDNRSSFQYTHRDAHAAHADRDTHAADTHRVNLPSAPSGIETPSPDGFVSEGT